jgi:hypothetical protein
MNTNSLAFTFLSLCLGLCFETLAYGRSEEMLRELNAPVPKWLSLAESIKAEPIEEQSLPTALSFRPRSGGATNTRNKVQIPARGLEFSFDYSITWRGGSDEGHGVSLSPDEKMLLVNSGTTPHLYEITSDGKHQEIPIRLPNVTYDDRLKGFITGWSWVSNEALLGIAEITDERGHELIENRLYLFHLKEQALARLDLSALKLTDDDANIEIVSIGEDLEHLRILAGDRELTLKANLKSPTTLHSEDTETSQADKLNPSMLWLVIAAVLVFAFSFGIILIKRKRK